MRSNHWILQIYIPFESSKWVDHLGMWIQLKNDLGESILKIRPKMMQLFLKHAWWWIALWILNYSSKMAWMGQNWVVNILDIRHFAWWCQNEVSTLCCVLILKNKNSPICSEVLKVCRVDATTDMEQRENMWYRVDGNAELKRLHMDGIREWDLVRKWANLTWALLSSSLAVW